MSGGRTEAKFAMPLFRDVSHYPNRVLQVHGGASPRSAASTAMVSSASGIASFVKSTKGQALSRSFRRQPLAQGLPEGIVYDRPRLLRVPGGALDLLRQGLDEACGKRGTLPHKGSPGCQRRGMGKRRAGHRSRSSTRRVASASWTTRVAHGSGSQAPWRAPRCISATIVDASRAWTAPHPRPARRARNLGAQVLAEGDVSGSADLRSRQGLPPEVHGAEDPRCPRHHEGHAPRRAPGEDAQDARLVAGVEVNNRRSNRCPQVDGITEEGLGHPRSSAEASGFQGGSDGLGHAARGHAGNHRRVGEIRHEAQAHDVPGTAAGSRKRGRAQAQDELAPREPWVQGSFRSRKVWIPHSVLALPRHLPARSLPSSPSGTGWVQGSQPVER